MEKEKTINESDNSAQKEVYRFLQDLEFIQCLANPSYLEYLSTNGYFKEQAFLNYLSYLQYFKKPEYMKYITYSRCFIFLDLLQYEFFRNELENPDFIRYLKNEIYANWGGGEK